jgi:hypothetical protein
MNLDVTQLKLYTIRNSSGQFYRSKGYGGSGVGSCWVDDINKARVYGTTGPARSVVTFFTKNYPNYPMPELIKLNVSGFEIMDETERVKKAIDKKKREEAAQQKRAAERAMVEAERKLAEAQKNLDKLKKK